MTIELPWPPSINHYWQRNRDGSVRVGAPGVRFRMEATQEFTRAYGLHFPPSNVRLSVKIYAHPPDKRRRDLDNTLKAILDSLQCAGAYEDDSQIDDLHIVRKKVVKGGKVRVSIMELEQSSDVEYAACVKKACH